jgi:[acyl-carrier-protein] S-malonyltransferase
VESINFLVAHGASHLIECGPGKVLAGLTRRIDRALETGFVDTPESLTKALALSS